MAELGRMSWCSKIFDADTLNRLCAPDRSRRDCAWPVNWTARRPSFAPRCHSHRIRVPRYRVGRRGYSSIWRRLGIRQFGDMVPGRYPGRSPFERGRGGERQFYAWPTDTPRFFDRPNRIATANFAVYSWWAAVVRMNISTG